MIQHEKSTLEGARKSIMKITKTNINGIMVIEPKVFDDERGYVLESYNQQDSKTFGITTKFSLDMECMSTYGVLSGLCWQASPYTQSKLVRVIDGTILAISMDVRKGSTTYGKHIAVELSGENKKQLFLPRGIAYGFAVLSQKAIYAIKCDNTTMLSAERGIRLDDPTLCIDWKVPRNQWIVSDKDKHYPSFCNIEPWEE